MVYGAYTLVLIYVAYMLGAYMVLIYNCAIIDCLNRFCDHY